MKIGKDLDLFDGPLEEYKYETYDSQLPESIVPGADTIEGRPSFPDPDLTEDGMVDMMLSRVPLGLLEEVTPQVREAEAG